jgi:polygalacturonase
MKVYNVKDFGAIADGQTLNSEAVQKAIDACSQTGGTVFFPKGEYVLATVFIKSNVTVELEEGAVILGSLDFYDYRPDEKVDYPLYQDASHSFFECSMFVGLGAKNIRFIGKGKVDMRSVWDEDNVRGIVHRGAKCIALKNCENVEIRDWNIQNVTDLAVYFAGAKNVEVADLTMRVYIDGVSPDNSENVKIHGCKIEAGDDAIVFKSSYTLNKLGICKNIHVWDCKLKSRCSAIKFGTETNGGFEDILIEDIDIFDTRITGIAIESVDGAIADGITVRNVRMKNVGAPLFVHVGMRMRGPQGREIGHIRNVTFENITAVGPYEPYEIVAWNYVSYVENDVYQEPWKMNFAYTDATMTKDDAWQISSNMCGLKDHPLENLVLRNVYLELDGGVDTFDPVVPEIPRPYPEVNTYGRILPAKGIYFRHINGLTMENVKVKTYRDDKREDFVFDRVENLKVQ